jgi:hypothetical protein
MAGVRVLGSRHNGQVVRVDTALILAPVVHLFAFGDRADESFPYEPMTSAVVLALVPDV